MRGRRAAPTDPMPRPNTVPAAIRTVPAAPPPRPDRATGRGGARDRRSLWAASLSILLLLPSPFLLTLSDFGRPPAEWWAAALFSGFAAISLGNMLWVYAAARVGPTLAGVYSNVLPVPSNLISWLWLGELLGAAKISGRF